MPRLLSFAVRRALAALCVPAVVLTCTALGVAAISGGPATPAPSFQSGEYVRTYASDCSTPQSTFNLGDTVCVEAGGFPAALSSADPYRRLLWVAPDHRVADTTYVKADPHYDKFLIPTSGAFALPGTWYVRGIDVGADGQAAARFVVRSPRQPWVDLSILKYGVDTVVPGSRVRFAVSLSNPGPDFAEGVQFIDDVPSNMTFLAIKQADGPFFECSTPRQGETGRTVCTTKGMAPDETALLYVYYVVDSDVRDDTLCVGEIQVTSYTPEMFKDDNYANFSVVATRTPPPDETVPVEDP